MIFIIYINRLIVVS